MKNNSAIIDVLDEIDTLSFLKDVLKWTKGVLGEHEIFINDDRDTIYMKIDEEKFAKGFSNSSVLVERTTRTLFHFNANLSSKKRISVVCENEEEFASHDER